VVGFALHWNQDGLPAIPVACETTADLAIRNYDVPRCCVRQDLLIISSTPSFQPDSPLPTNRTGRRIPPLEEFYVREKFPRYTCSVRGAGVLLPLEDDSRQMICTPGETPYRSVVVG